MDRIGRNKDDKDNGGRRNGRRNMRLIMEGRKVRETLGGKNEKGMRERKVEIRKRRNKE